MQKRIVFTLGVALSVLLFAGAFTQVSAQATQDKAEQEILKVVDEVLVALVKRDAAVIERVMTDDYFTIYEGGQVGDRARLIAGFKSTTFGWDDWQRAETKVNLHGDTAIVLCRYKVKAHTAQGSVESDWRSIGVMRKERGQWRMAASQFTTVRPPAPPAPPKQP